MNNKSLPADPAHHIAVFQEAAIRRTWHENEWRFSFIDVVGILSETHCPRREARRSDTRLNWRDG